MKQSSKTCNKCGFVGIKQQDFARTLIREKYQYGNCKKCAQELTRAWRYGLTIPELRELLKVTHCEVCNKEFTTNRKVIDHCHENPNKNVRGVLCDPCNTTLGQLEKTPEMMGNIIAYLLKHKTN